MAKPSSRWKGELAPKFRGRGSGSCISIHPPTVKPELFHIGSNAGGQLQEVRRCPGHASCVGVIRAPSRADSESPIRRPPIKVVPPRHIIRAIGGCALPTRKMTELSDDSLERQEEIDKVFRRRGSCRRNNAVRLKDSAARLGPVSLAHGKVILGGDDWGDDISCSVCISRRWLPWSRLGSNLDL